jgi:hypothetical protein
MFARRLAGAAAVLGVAFVAIQFIRPGLKTSPVAGDRTLKQPAKQILRDSCYDCHSSETRLAWFDHTVPAYWLVAADVRRGRERLDFSNFDRLPGAQQRGILFEAVNQMQFGVMPPKKYSLLHPESRVTPDKVATLERYLMASTHTADAGEPRQEAPQLPTTPANVRPAPNGIAFEPAYKDWKAIGSTERFDNDTLRVVLANDTAVAAIQSNRVNPWPDGTTFAKVAWTQRADGAGSVAAGEFVQVEFMIKGKTQYASTDGWGFARWRGADLVPYGQSAAFTEECVGCHTPMRSNDFVFTEPFRGLAGRDASIVAGLPFNFFRWKVIASSIHPDLGTTEILYGNDPAVRDARAGSHATYTTGSSLALVTWSQQADGHWFGARKPDQIKSVEFVTVESAADQPASRSYQEFSGPPWKKVASNPTAIDARVHYILAQRASPMP